MLKLFGYKLILVIFLSVICNSFAAEKAAQPLVSPELLEYAGLRTLWQQKLPIKATEYLDEMLILGDRIYIFSNRNYIISLDRNDGEWIFGEAFSPGTLPVGGLRLYRDELLSANGNELVEFEVETGNEFRKTEVENAIVCPVVRNNSYFYISEDDRRLHVLRAKDMVQIFEVAADNGSMITSVIAEEDFVIFGTEKGNVVSIAPDQPKRFWQFNAADAIVGPLIKDGRSLFFACADTNVYRVDIVGFPEQKRFVWKYQMPGILEKAPRVTRQFVYQYAITKGVTAIGKAGTFLWNVPLGVDLLAEYNDKAYVITEDRKLVVMDNIESKRLYSVNFAAVTRHASNVTDSMIYIADERGRVACLQPVE
jgi:outer membrane protein assembly factor BamB